MESSVNDRSLLRVDRVGTQGWERSQGWRGGSGGEQVGCEGMRLCVLARPLSPLFISLVGSLIFDFPCWVFSAGLQRG